MKKLFFLLLILILIPISYSLQECQRVMQVGDIPCTQVSSWLPPNQCSSYPVQIINISNQTMQTLTWSQAITSCQFIFNITTPGTYNFYSSIDTGWITIEERNSMIYLIYFAVAMAFLLMIIGFWKEDPTFLAISGILFMVVGVYIAINGFSSLNNLITQGVACICIAWGGYVFVRTGLEGILHSGI